MKIITNSPEETKALAQKFSRQFKGGEIIGLVGDLGTGKTVFVQGLAESLGIKEVVNSPTFVLMKIYQTNSVKSTALSLVHLDAYRLTSFDELKAIGLEEYLNNQDYLVVIEWANQVSAIKKYPKYQEIIFKEGKKENQRAIFLV